MTTVCATSGDLIALKSKLDTLVSTIEGNEAQIKSLEVRCQEEGQQLQETRLVAEKWKQLLHGAESELVEANEELSKLRTTNGELMCKLSLSRQAFNARDCKIEQANSLEVAQLQREGQIAQKSLLQLQEDNAQLHARLVELDRELKETGQLREDLKSKRLSPR